MINITRVQISPESISMLGVNLLTFLDFHAEKSAPEPSTAAPTPAPRTRPAKLAADGSTAADTATDHAAVIDPSTGLMWATQTSEDRISWEAADKAARACTLLGYTDWRLPTIKELMTLIDHERSEPAIDTDLFPGTKSDRYWSSSPLVGLGGCAWYVYFGLGLVSSNHRGGGGFVRPVRVASPRQ